MIAIQCPDGHVYTHHKPIVADLASGPHAITFCPVCDVRTYTELTEAKAAELLAGCAPRLMGDVLRVEQDRHATATYGPIQQIEWWSHPLTTDPIAGDALIGAWLGQEASHV